MKLQSTPKPVRFRISSGGQEHSSLESLLSCFDYNELKTLKSKLIQWLERQGTKGKEIANLLGNCDGMPTFEDAIKYFYDYDCETIINNWFETKSANLRFVDLDLIKNNQRLLVIAYKNKELIPHQISYNQWLEAINTHKRIDDIDLLNFKSKIELEIEKEKLRKDFEKKQEERRKNTQEPVKQEKPNEDPHDRNSWSNHKEYKVRFRISRGGSRHLWGDISAITNILENELRDLFINNKWSRPVYLTQDEIKLLEPNVDRLEINGKEVRL